MKNVFFILTLLAFTSSHADTVIGNSGGRSDPYYNTVWFVGESKTVNICYEVSKDFEFGDDEIRNTIQGAYIEWTNYLSRHGFYSETYQARSAQDLEYVKKFNPARNFNIQSKCDSNSDLTIYFGVQTQHVAKTAMRYNYKLGFADPGKRDLDLGWNKGGFIYVRSGIYNYGGALELKKLFGLLLHEFGHVFGVPHVPMTIMAENFSDYYDAVPGIVDAIYHFTHIDWERSLILSHAKRPTFYDVDTYTEPKGVDEIFGANPKQRLTARIVQLEDKAAVVIDQLKNGNVFMIDIDTRLTSRGHGDLSLFCSVLREAGTGIIRQRSATQEHVVRYGTLTGINEKKYQVMIEENVQLAYLLTILLDDKEVLTFTTSSI